MNPQFSYRENDRPPWAPERLLGFYARDIVCPEKTFDIPRERKNLHTPIVETQIDSVDSIGDIQMTMVFWLKETVSALVMEPRIMQREKNLGL